MEVSPRNAAERRAQLRAYERKTTKLYEIWDEALKEMARIVGGTQNFSQPTEEELIKRQEQHMKVEKARQELEDHKNRQMAMEALLPRDLVDSDSSAEEKRYEFMQIEKRLRSETAESRKRLLMIDESMPGSSNEEKKRRICGTKKDLSMRSSAVSFRFLRQMPLSSPNLEHAALICASYYAHHDAGKGWKRARRAPQALHIHSYYVRSPNDGFRAFIRAYFNRSLRYTRRRWRTGSRSYSLGIHQQFDGFCQRKIFFSSPPYIPGVRVCTRVCAWMLAVFFFFSYIRHRDVHGVTIFFRAYLLVCIQATTGVRSGVPAAPVDSLKKKKKFASTLPHGSASELASCRFDVMNYQQKKRKKKVKEVLSRGARLRYIIARHRSRSKVCTRSLFKGRRRRALREQSQREARGGNRISTHLYSDFHDSAGAAAVAAQSMRESSMPRDLGNNQRMERVEGTGMAQNYSCVARARSVENEQEKKYKEGIGEQKTLELGCIGSAGDGGSMYFRACIPTRNTKAPSMSVELRRHEEREREQLLAPSLFSTQRRAIVETCIIFSLIPSLCISFEELNSSSRHRNFGLWRSPVLMVIAVRKNIDRKSTFIGEEAEPIFFRHIFVRIVAFLFIVRLIRDTRYIPQRSSAADVFTRENRHRPRPHTLRYPSTTASARGGFGANEIYPTATRARAWHVSSSSSSGTPVVYVVMRIHARYVIDVEVHVKCAYILPI
ncbi:unnamed protein product [Trichogramma brassicae]|uniref:Uncharacterized protein n=1 Tax=Trichogramma brassicae TaxID=86971 RepID=A0A6H5HSK0_9HYME|nr:unnamed protein product [Trichogramma brassicae]